MASALAMRSQLYLPVVENHTILSSEEYYAQLKGSHASIISQVDITVTNYVDILLRAYAGKSMPHFDTLVAEICTQAKMDGHMDHLPIAIQTLYLVDVVTKILARTEFQYLRDTSKETIEEVVERKLSAGCLCTIL
jgi:hypothetical protein